MEQNTSASKSGLQYALLFGVIMIFEFIIGYVLNIDPQTNKTYGITISVLNYFILPFVLIYVACNNYKMKLNSGFISFGQCLKVGVSLCVVAGLIYALFTTAFQMIFPEYFDEVFRKMQSVMLKENPQMTQEQIDMSVSMMKKFSNPVFAIPITIVMFAFIGLIHSLIVGAIVKKDANQSF